MDLKFIILIAIVAVILLLLAGLAVVNFSYDEVLDKFNEISKYNTTITPIDFALKISKKYFKGSIKINFTNKKLGDMFKSSGVMVLCSEYASLKRLSGLAICAHELGHAFQFGFQKEKMKKYSKKVRLSKFLSKLIMPLILASIVLLFLNKIYICIAVFAVAIVFFILAIFAKLSTIKVEKEASEKAIELLKENTELSDEDLKAVNRFLDSAKLTYIADLLRTMLRWTGLTRQ